jgi:hypothetical protein
MINLDFKFIDDVKGPEGLYPDLWVDGCQLGAFEGFQTLIVQDKDFSGPVPILGFARRLKMVAYEFANGLFEEQTYRDLSSEWIMRFRSNGESVEVSDHRGQASVPLDEFLWAVGFHSKRAYEACCEISPAIKDNEFISEWWNNVEYSLATFEPQITDPSSLTPRNLFYEKPD